MISENYLCQCLKLLSGYIPGCDIHTSDDNFADNWKPCHQWSDKSWIRVTKLWV